MDNIFNGIRDLIITDAQHQIEADKKVIETFEKLTDEEAFWLYQDHDFHRSLNRLETSCEVSDAMFEIKMKLDNKNK